MAQNPPVKPQIPPGFNLRKERREATMQLAARPLQGLGIAPHLRVPSILFPFPSSFLSSKGKGEDPSQAAPRRLFGDGCAAVTLPAFSKLDPLK